MFLCFVLFFCSIIFMLSSFVVLFFFFFKQKTAYEMRISDWSSDVCSSDLVRLLRTDHDGLGPGRREPPALLAGTDGLRHARFHQPAPARRPGLLLQPGQPRRDLHRKRSDRARGQPAHRCRLRSGVPDADQRRSPTRLIKLNTIASKTGRPLWWAVGLLLAAVVAATLVVVLSGDEPGKAPVLHSPSARQDLAAAALSRVVTGVETDDRDALRGASTPDVASRLADNASDLEVTDFTLRYVDEDRGLSASLPEGRWAAAVDATWRFDGFDPAPAHAEIGRAHV